MKKSLLLLPALASMTLMSCTMTGGNALVNGTQTYAISCVPAINAVAAAAGNMNIPDPDFTRSSYRFAQRGSTELTIYAQSSRATYSGRRETWSEWTCQESNGQAILSVKTSGLDATTTNRLHSQFFSALNLPRP